MARHTASESAAGKAAVRNACENFGAPGLMLNHRKQLLGDDGRLLLSQTHPDFVEVEARADEMAPAERRHQEWLSSVERGRAPASRPGATQIMLTLP